MTRPSSPYPGPRPFEIDERKKFFGREREAREIISLIIAHPTVLLYAESGAGKTSLLNARIIPLLRDRGADVIGATRVSGELPPSVTAADVGNIFTFHAIHGLDNAPPPPPRAGEDASAAPAAMAPDPRTRTRTTLREYVLARPRQPRREGEIVPPRVILFDQFEEVFTTSQARWADRGAFFEDLGDTLDADPNLRIVFVMREEYVAALDPFAAALPRRLRTRYRLERLRKEAAVLAVTEPLKGTGYTLSTEAAETLVENLMRVPGESTVAPASPTGEAPADRAAAGGAAERHVLAETVEPVQLQVVCVQIWDSLPPPPAEIDVERIKTYGDVDRALTSYYEQSICNALTCDVAIENGVTESALRNWFEQALITADGTRGTVYRGAEKTGELPTRLVELLDIRFRLVRPELRGTATWYELTHDRFIAPIRESNRRYFLEQTSGAALAAMLQGRANLWREKGKKPELLLRGGDLATALEWKERNESPIELSPVVDEFLLASHAHQQIRRRVVRIGAVTGGFMAVAMVFGLWAMAGKRSAENAMYAERGRIASMFADQPGHEFEALLLGTRAVGPRLEAGRPPPPEAVEGIGDAIATIGDAVFLRDSSGSDVVDFSSDDERILTQSSSRIIVWDALGRQLFSKFADSSGEHRTRDSERVVWRYAKLWPNGRWVVASLGPPRFGDLGPSTRPERYADSIGLHIYNVETGARMPEAEATLGQIDLIGFVPNTPRFYTLRSHPNAAEGDVHLYSGEPGQPIRRVARFAGWSDAVLSPRGSRIATAGADSFAIWDTETGRRIGGARREESVEWMLFSSDDSVLVTTRFPSEGLWMWNAITGQPLGTIIRSNLFSAYPLMTDGKSVVGFNPVEDSVFIWRLPGEGPDRSIHAADYGIRGIYPTGLLLLKAEKQRTRFIVATWNPLLADTPTLYPQLVLFGGNSSARVSDDGTRVALLEPEQSRVRVFRLNQPSHPSRSSSPGRLYAIACDRLAREPTEWQALRKENLCRTETLKKFRG